MSFSNLKLWIANAGGFFAANPIVLIIGGGLVAVLVISGLVSRSCQSRKIEKIQQNIERGKTNAVQSESEANVYANLANEQKGVVENAANNSNAARNAVNDVFNRDSNQFPMTYSEAKRKFCAEHPEDSACGKSK